MVKEMIMNIPNKNELNKFTLQERIFKKKWPKFYSFLIDNYKDCKTLSEKLYLYYNDLDKKPLCIVCGSETKFDGFFRGFRDHCCSKCAQNNISVRDKSHQTNLERYGYMNNLQNPIIKEKIKQTILEKYGVENISQNEFIKEKKKQTSLKHYGVANPMLNDEVKEKMIQTNLKKYGRVAPTQNKIVREKVKYTFHQTFIDLHPDLIRYDKDDKWICKCPHPECDKCSEKEYITYSKLYYSRGQNGTELCTKLLPIQSFYSTPELQIRNFLDSLNIEYITNDRSIITPKELDIYIPSKKIAIEFNGSYWHSNKDKYYHQNKTKTCYSKGVLLVHIYEHEWNNDKESVLSKLKDILDDKEVDGIVSVKDYDKYTLSEPVLIDCGSYKIWNEGNWQLK